MATQILATNTTAASSSDVAVVAGTPLTVCLKDAAGPSIGVGAKVHVELKDDAGQYFRVDVLTSEKPSLVIFGPGAYRFSRPAGVSCGVFSG